jgi:hypothetical protein
VVIADVGLTISVDSNATPSNEKISLTTPALDE